MKFTTIFVAVVATALVGDALASTIKLNTGHIDPASHPSVRDVVAARDASVPSKTGLRQYLVHVGRPLSVTEQTQLNAALALNGAKLGQYIPDHAFLVAMDETAALQDYPHVEWVGEYLPSYKIQPSLETRVEKFAVESVNNIHELEAHHAAVRSGAATARSIVKTSDSAKLVVLLTPRETLKHDRDLIANSAAEWEALLPAGSSIEVVNAHKVIATVPTDAAADAAAVLAEQDEVHWIEAKEVMFELNKHAASYLQGGTVAVAATPGTHPIWAAGLTGLNQIVGVGDSGLDAEMCYFSDPNGEQLAIYPNSNQNHRKVITYVDFVDATDSTPSGHGTHCVGSVLGQTDLAGGYDGGNGMAPDAKVAFFDMGDSTPANAGRIYTPNDLASEYLQPVYDLGARLHSNSWGSSPLNAQGQPIGTQYSSNSAEMDQFQWDNKDMLVLVAAGNSGDAGLETVGAPATAKNIISVGATQNHYQSWRDYCCLDQPTSPCLIPDGQACTQNFINALNTNSLPYSEVSMASFSSRGPLTQDGRIKPDMTAPGSQTMSAKSQAGTADQCGTGDPRDSLAMKSGTSMATPTLAGLAAVTRQYYTEGFYPSGEANADDAITPSAALLKATLMGGARDMTGQIAGLGTIIPAAPSVYQGFGRAQLHESIYVAAAADTTTNRMAISLNDAGEDNTLSTGQTSAEFCVEAAVPEGNTDPLKFTLVWTDPAGSPAAQVALVNNLDLVVTGDGATFIGNQDIDGAAGADTINNAEQVRIPNPVDGEEYCATVTGTNVPQGPQPYALTAHGPIGQGGEDGPGGELSTGGKVAVAAIGSLVGIALIAGVAVFVLPALGVSACACKKDNDTEFGNTYGAPQGSQGGYGQQQQQQQYRGHPQQSGGPGYGQQQQYMASGPQRAAPQRPSRGGGPMMNSHSPQRSAPAPPRGNYPPQQQQGYAQGGRGGW